MATIVATIKGIQVVNQENVNALYLTLDKEFDVFRLKDGVYSSAKAKDISFNRSAFTAQCCELDVDVALYRACCDGQFTQKQLALIFIGAAVTIETEEFHLGDEYVDKDGNTKTHDHDGYQYTIVSLKLTDRALERIDKACQL